MPVTVERRWKGQIGSLTWWVDDVMMDENERDKQDAQPPSAFEFNGTWKGMADGPPETLVDMSFTIAGNRLIRITCGSVILTIADGSAVTDGAFSFSVDSGVRLAGRILSADAAVGEINVPPCGPTWYASKQ